MTSMLSIANGALRLLRETPLTSNELTNSTREPARIFNAIWDNGGQRAVLEAGQWRFAKRSISLDSSPSLEPEGYTYAFEKPSDWVRTIGVWASWTMSDPLRDYRDEAGYMYANIDPVIVAYVSDDSLFGGDMSLWPQSFVSFVHAYVASEMEGPLTDKGLELLKLRKRLLDEASSLNASVDPSRRMPAGSWVRARMGLSTSREEG